MMTAAEYERHLEGGLCWHCHVATHKSHARQRQCPACRRKWSYHHRQLEWRLLKAFCEVYSVRHTSRTLHVAYRTVWNHFMRFEIAVRRADKSGELVEVGTRQAGYFPFHLAKKTSPRIEVQQATVVFVYEKFIRTGIPKRA
jgi:hypothetical protein